MLTAKQIDRDWQQGRYDQLARAALAPRPDAPVGTAELIGHSAIGAAAAVLLRLFETAQHTTAQAKKLAGFLVARQELSGGWGEVATTVLAARALAAVGLRDRATTAAVWLAGLQRDDGALPRSAESIAPCAATTLLAVRQLAAVPLAADVLDLPAAVAWLGRHASELPTGGAQQLNAARMRIAAQTRASVPAALPVAA